MEVPATRASWSVSLSPSLGLGTCKPTQVGGGQGPAGSQRILWIGEGWGRYRWRVDFSGSNVGVSMKEVCCDKTKVSHWLGV